MTVVATWYHKGYDEIWCASDTRITSGGAIATDSGPKILPIPIVAHWAVSGSPSAQCQQFSLGFAYAGNTLSAISTHALASACTQNLACNKPDIPPPSVEGVAELFRKVGEYYVRDISTRMVGSQVESTAYFFAAHILGFCRVSNRYRAFVIYPELLAGQFSMKVAELQLEDWRFFALGSGAETLIEINEELKRAGKTSGAAAALREMLRRDTTPDVGGYFQFGMASRLGFNLCPILNIGGPQDRHLTFLGFSVSDAGELDGYNFGYRVFAPDVDLTS